MTPLRERREQRVAVVKTLRKANSRMSKSCELDRGRRSDYRAKSVRWFPSLVPAMVQTEGYTEVGLFFTSARPILLVVVLSVCFACSIGLSSHAFALCI